MEDGRWKLQDYPCHPRLNPSCGGGGETGEEREWIFQTHSKSSSKGDSFGVEPLFDRQVQLLHSG